MDHGNFKLTDLVALGQIRVEIIFACEHAALCDVRAQRQSEFDGALDRTFVHHWQRARQGQVHRASLRVGLRTKGRGGATEDFALRRELRVGFEPDHHFIPMNQFGGAHLHTLRFGQVMLRHLLKAMRQIQQRCFLQIIANQLQADRQACVTQTHRDAHARQPGE